MHSNIDLIERLSDSSAEGVLWPGGPGWADVAPLFAMAGEPVAVVRPTDARRVAFAVGVAAEEALSVSVRGGGHGAATFPNAGGLVIDLSRIRDISVDGTRVSIGGGALWGDVAAELGRHGLALSSGDTKSVGVGGLTLSGGIGWMVRNRGLAIDALVGAEVVLASGEIVTASADEHPDLFWAIRGGGGNFGIVTTFIFDAQPLDGVVVDHLEFTRDDLRGVLRGYRDHMREAPEELNVTFLAHPPMGPGAEPMTQLISVYPGRDVAHAEPLIAPLRALPGFVRDDMGAHDYCDALEDPPPPFEGEYPTIVGNNAFVDDFSDEVIDAIVSAMEGAAGSMLMVRYLRGAYNRVGKDATAWAHRQAEVFVVVAAFLPPNASAVQQEAVHDAWSPVAPFASGVYGNFASVTNESVVGSIYPPEIRDRLRAVKQRYDPQNLFHHNHNIVP